MVLFGQMMKAKTHIREVEEFNPGVSDGTKVVCVKVPQSLWLVARKTALDRGIPVGTLVSEALIKHLESKTKISVK